MFVKLQLDTGTGCFPLLGSTKILPKIGLSVSPLEKLENINKDRRKQQKQRLVQTKPTLDRTNGSGLVHDPAVKKHRLVENPDGEKRETCWDGGGIENKRSSGLEVKRDLGVKKVHSKCSTKWVSYGGCIPAILQALDEVKDLDEALKPWEENLNNKERSIILKEQVSWERALEIFEWFKRKGCYELNVIHYNIMLRTLGKARKWSSVERLWEEMCLKGIVPINSTYGTLIDVYSKGGRKEEALVWLERMNKRGMEPDEVTMGIVVQMYKKAGEFQKAEDFFKKWSLGQVLRKEGNAMNGASKMEGSMNSNVCLSSHTYNTLIDTYGKAGQLKEASEVFARMLIEGKAPTTVTFNTMIHICGNNGQLEEANLLMRKMEELRCSPDTRTYNILISLHTKHNNINMATNYFRKMKEASLKPDLVSYRTLLYAYSIRQMVHEAEDLVAEMDFRGIEIDEFTQSALTRMQYDIRVLFCQHRRVHGERGHISEAENVFCCCQEGNKLSVLEFNVMIKAYGLAKCYRKACELFDSMDSGLVSDCIPYCAVISSFVKLGRLEMAEELYKEMVGFGLQPDIIVFGILINAFADVGCVKEALGYVDAMKNAGLPGNAVIYNSLIKLYTKVGFLKEAQETYKLLQLSEEGPALYSSNCMIDLYSERSMVQPAEEIFESLKRERVANEFTFSMMLCMYKKIGRFEEAIVIAKQMKEKGLLTDLLSYNNVLGLYAMCGRFKDVVATFDEMIKASVEPDDCTFKSLAVVMVKSGVPKQAVGKLEVETKKDARNGLRKWASALSSVVGFDDYDDDV